MIRLVARAANGTCGAIEASVNAELRILRLIGDEGAQTIRGVVQKGEAHVDVADIRRLGRLSALLGLRTQAASQNQARDYANTCKQPCPRWWTPLQLMHF